MTALPSISVNTCEIEFFDGEEDCIGTPTSMRGQSVEIAGKLRRFRVTSLDEMKVSLGQAPQDTSRPPPILRVFTETFGTRMRNITAEFFV